MTGSGRGALLVAAVESGALLVDVERKKTAWRSRMIERGGRIER